MIDAAQNILAFNKGAEIIFGYSANEVIGKSVSILMPSRYSHAHITHVTNFASHGDVSRRMGERREIYGKRRNGEEFPADAGIVKMIQPNGNMVFTVILRDVTERRQWEEEKRTYSNQLAVLAERSRIARELHDAVTQSLFSANIMAQVLPQMLEKDRAAGLRQIDDICQLTRSALAEMRAMLIELRPTAITESNLRDLIKQLAEVSSNRTGIKMTVEANGQARLPAAVQVAFYRIAQESLNNIAKHSEATEATIQLNLHPKMSNLLIHDNGRGFDPTQTKANHFGLKIMHERAQEIGAEIEIDSTVGLGTDILMTWRKEDDSSDDY